VTKERQVIKTMIARLGIKVSTSQQVAGTLSGGNQQKIVLGKWLATDPSVLLLDEPTRGVDIGAKSEIYGLMEELAAQGLCILFASSELEEILGIAHKVVVMRQGQITGVLEHKEMSEQSIMMLATRTESGA
jgi:ribose transport system ATP-binding protein